MIQELSRRARKRRARFVVDDSAITIEKNVPLPL